MERFPNANLPFTRPRGHELTGSAAAGAGHLGESTEASVCYLKDKTPSPGSRSSALPIG